MKVLIAVLIVLAAAPASAAQEACSAIPTEAAVNNPQPRPNDPNWYAAFQATQSVSSNAELLLIGDSIVGRWRPAWRENDFRGITTLNWGVDGDRVSQVRWRIQNGIAIPAPKYIVLSVGTNGITLDSAVELASGIISTVADIQARFPQAKIIVMSILPRGQKGPENDRISEVNDLLFRCHAGRYYYLDQWAAFSDGEGTLSRNLSDDGLHPNPTGYRLLGASIVTVIESTHLQTGQ